MLRDKGVIAILAATLGMQACTTAPRPVPKASKDVSFLVNRLQCELTQAYNRLSPHYPELRSWRAALDLTLKLSDQGTLAPTAGVLSTTSTRLLGIDVGGSYASGAARTEQLKFRIDFKDTVHLVCLDERGQKLDLSQSSPDVPGGFGFYYWIKQSLEATAPEGRMHAVDTIAEVVEFSVDMSGSVTPSFSILRQTSINQTAGMSVSKKSLNTLALAITKIPAETGTAGADQKLDRAIQPLAYPATIAPN